VAAQVVWGQRICEEHWVLSEDPVLAGHILELLPFCPSCQHDKDEREEAQESEREV
jgi:hypothetical protein